MGKIDISFKPQIFRKDFPMVIATNRSSAVLLPVRLEYDADGYVAGQVLSAGTTPGFFKKYDDNAKCILFESVGVQDFDSATGSTTAVGIFGGCTVYKDKLIDYDANVLADLKGTLIVDATGVETLKF